MGSIYSRNPKTFERSESAESYGECCCPEDLLVEILSFVPAKDLLKNCSLVCRQWRDVISEHGVWKRKCLRDGKCIPSYKFETIPRNYYRLIYLNDPYGRNLLKNPCGTDEFKHWIFKHSQGDGWIIENPPNGADPVPQEVDSQSCFVTSYGQCEKYQLISLFDEGLILEVIDSVRPDIEIGEWHAARFDCGSVYSLHVSLLNKDLQSLDKFEFGPYQEEQWTGRAWSKVSHTFKNYPCGVCYISFEHYGIDTQFWAGHYGSKMTGAYVRFKCK